MSPLGIFHTTVSVLPVGFGLYAYLRDGRIDLKTRVGKLYWLTMVVGSVTALGFIPTKGFGPPQVLTLLTLGLLLASVMTPRGRWRGEGHVRTVSLTLSYFLLWFFTTTETLTRLPKGEPFASGPNDPALLPVRLALLVVLAIGLTLQVRRLRAAPALVPVR
ncbi:MAG TPA: hypothetical protein VM529_09335 [Gemmata sp.]|jgi:hypothetical protein|nr:hypothetical protein [Gemmata sp.]